MHCDNCLKKLDHRGKYCSNWCQQEKQYKDYIARWKTGQESGLTGNKCLSLSSHVERYIRAKYSEQCANCKWGEINPYSNTVPVEIDHIDGNHLNNTESNLRLLCPNCHSLTRTFRNLNKGSGRAYRRIQA